MDDNSRFLAWFLGPKAEHADLLEEGLMLVLRDYIHWRRNYFPGDKILINKGLQRELEGEYDTLTQTIMEMTAELRRNFPFYSPRYIAHQLSDTTLPAIIGYIAGMLYNPNNVTPEAAPVTVEWEIEACNRILEMLGYKTPPAPPTSHSDVENYEKKLQQEFGWAHITLGGTTANVEALWVARTVRYFPLAVREVALQHDLDIPIHLSVAQPGETVETRDIKDFTEREVLLLRPNESIYLLGRYVKAVQSKFGIEVAKAGTKAWELLNSEQCQYSLAKGTGSLFYEYPPVLFVSGAAHYSIGKAADVLGIGKDNVRLIRMQDDFRIDVRDLEYKIIEAHAEGKIPLAVIAIAGTTEEGAVDPVHTIVDLREKLEKEHGISFWLHIDAAWGGFIRTLFRDSDATLFKLSRKFDIAFGGNLRSWHERFFKKIVRVVEEATRNNCERLLEETSSIEVQLRDLAQNDHRDEYVESLRILLTSPWTLVLPIEKSDFELASQGRNASADPSQESQPLNNAALADSKAVLSQVSRKFDLAFSGNLRSWHERFFKKTTYIIEEESIANRDRLLEKLSNIETRLRDVAIFNDPEAYVKGLRILLAPPWRAVNEILRLDKVDFDLNLQSRVEMVDVFTRDNMEINWGDYQKRKQIKWGSRELCSAYVAFQDADSITIDPHKMGYTPYPCGVVAFKNDRIRHFIMQKAPYITSATHDVLTHTPPKHLDRQTDGSEEMRIDIDAFGPFILEGSKPGAAASGLWTAVRTIPLTIKEHGAIIRASLLAARELYEWLIHWNRIITEGIIDRDYQIIPIIKGPPDTNIVIFAVKKRTSTLLRKMNQLTKLVYDHFTIQAEFGDKKYSYAQPFFLSKTACQEPEYLCEMLSPFFDRCGLRNYVPAYKEDGLVILRATIMNPYIHPLRLLDVQNVIREFIIELDKAASSAVDKIK